MASVKGSVILGFQGRILKSGLPRISHVSGPTSESWYPVVRGCCCATYSDVCPATLVPPIPSPSYGLSTP